MMDPKKDAYGQEIWAYLKQKPSYEIVERDDGFINFSQGAAVYFQKFHDWPSGQKKAIALAKGNVLDIGTGAGRVALYLQKKRLKVTAIDNSPLAIKTSRARGVKNARLIPIEKVGRLPKNYFNTVIMFGNNFGLFGGPKKAKSLLKELYKITAPDALILAESVDVYDTKDPVHLNYHKLNKSRGRMAGELRIRIRFRNYIGNWFDYLLVSPKEMAEIVKGTGWKIKKFIKSDKYLYCAVISK